MRAILLCLFSSEYWPIDITQHGFILMFSYHSKLIDKTCFSGQDNESHHDADLYVYYTQALGFAFSLNETILL